MYHYAGNNPIKYTDPDGCFAENAWDVLSLAAGVRSFVRNVKSGDVGGAVLDAVGIIADAAAVALPCIPGGAGAAIKAVRATKAVANGVMGTCQIAAGVNNIAEGIQNSDAGQVLDGSIQVISGTMTVAGAMNELEAVSKMPKATPEIKKSNHGNSLDTTKPAQGYALRDKDTGEILKYGETTRGNKRYSSKYLTENNAYMDFQANGTKREMHDWQHEKILDYKYNNGGNRPPLNKSDW